jgi:hypothetical protein
MSYKHNIIKERFDLPITAENQTFKQEFELDKNANYLVGIALTSSRDDLMFYRGTQKILLNDMELFPEGFESKLLLSGLNVAPDNRMITVGQIKTGNGKLEISYTDKQHELIKFSPYRISIYAFSVVEINSDY